MYTHNAYIYEGDEGGVEEAAEGELRALEQEDLRAAAAEASGASVCVCVCVSAYIYIYNMVYYLILCYVMLCYIMLCYNYY